MDINEVNLKMVGRHPWELSRTKCVARVFRKQLKYKNNNISNKYLNIGAGDMYFDRYWLSIFPRSALSAVDIGYGKDCTQTSDKDARINKFYSLDDIGFSDYDYAIMMDSLEYMDDDIEYLHKLASYLKKDGYAFFTVPAFQRLFSEHDIHVRGLRRYDKKQIYAMAEELDEFDLVHFQYFYFSLFVIRFFQVFFKVKIDSGQKITTGWPFKERNVLTKLVTMAFDLDFLICNAINRIGINVPGLSALFVLKKK